MEKNIRECLIENAQRLIAERGYHKTRVEDITKASGVAKGTFYNYFNSKEDLIATFLKEMLQNYMRFLNEIVDEEIEFREKIKKIMGIELAALSNNPALFLTVMELKRLRTSEKPLTAVSDKLKEVRDTMIYDLTERLFRKHADEIREEYRDKTLDLAFLLGSFTFGFLMVRISTYMDTRDKDKEFKMEELEERLREIDIEEEVKFLSSIYIRGILKGEEK